MTSPWTTSHYLVSVMGYLIDKRGDLARPEVVSAVLHQRLVAPTKAQQVDGKHSVRLCQLVDVVAPVICARAKAVDQQQGRALCP